MGRFLLMVAMMLVIVLLFALKPAVALPGDCTQCNKYDPEEVEDEDFYDYCIIMECPGY